MQTSMKKMFGENTKLPEWNMSPELGSKILAKFSEVFDQADSQAF
jgi:hypothetical protein